MRWEAISLLSPEEFRRLTGVKRHTFEEMVKLLDESRTANRALSSQRVLNENVIGMLKRFKIIAGKYRNRRKLFGLRFNLIAGIYNYELNK